MNRILTFLLIALSLTAAAQKDPKAKEILDLVSKKIRSFTTIEAKFVNIMENQKEKVSESIDGKLMLKGKKYRIEVLGVITQCDGATKWVYMPEPNEVTVTSISDMTPEEKEGNLLADPTEIFTIYEKGFKYQYMNDEIIDGIKNALIELVPEDREKPYFKIKLYIDRDKSTPSSLMYFGKDGTRYNIKIKEFNPNVLMDDALFVFNKAKYPGVEVIDLREE